MDSSTILFIGAIGFFLNCLVLFFIIKGATQADKRALYEWAQVDLLCKIAKAQGVPDEEIAKTIRVLK